MNRSAPPTDPLDPTRHYQVDAVAADYDRVRFGGLRGSLVHALECRLVRRGLRAANGTVRTVLDLPVGTGRLTRTLHDVGYKMVGADISAAMLRHAHERGGAHPLVRADALALPLRAASVDAVVCLRLLSHLDPTSRRALLGEMARVARVAVVAVYQPHRRSLWYLVRNQLQGRPLPRYQVSATELDDEFARSGLVNIASFALLPGIFMERAYVLTPGRSATGQARVKR